MNITSQLQFHPGHPGDGTCPTVRTTEKSEGVFWTWSVSSQMPIIITQSLSVESKYTSSPAEWSFLPRAHLFLIRVLGFLRILETLAGSPQIKTIFIIILRGAFPFSLAYSYSAQWRFKEAIHCTHSCLKRPFKCSSLLQVHT